MSGAWWIVAAVIVATHLALCAFLVIGGPVGVRRRNVAQVHMLCFVPVAIIHVLGLDCPLTLAENWARQRAAGDAYDGGFIEHYLLQPLGLTPSPLASLAIGSAVLVPTAAALLWRRFEMRDVPYAGAR